MVAGGRMMDGRMGSWVEGCVMNDRDGYKNE